MDSEYPQFNEPIAIDARRSWTATFDSYNLRLDDLYYVASIREEGGDVTEIMVQVSWWGQETGDFAGWLREEIQRVVATGKTNTEYAGYNQQYRKSD